MSSRDREGRKEASDERVMPEGEQGRRRSETSLMMVSERGERGGRSVDGNV